MWFSSHSNLDHLSKSCSQFISLHCLLTFNISQGFCTRLLKLTWHFENKFTDNLFWHFKNIQLKTNHTAQVQFCSELLGIAGLSQIFFIPYIGQGETDTASKLNYISFSDMNVRNLQKSNILLLLLHVPLVITFSFSCSLSMTYSNNISLLICI